MSSLGNDLARLRKEQDLTLEDIRDQTKIPIRILQSIENDTIFSDIDENRTYIRSFVRSYGKALQIDEHLMRIALDQTEADQYQDLLQKVDPYDPGEITDEPPFTIPDQGRDDRNRWRKRKERRGKSKDNVGSSEKRKHDPSKIRDLSRQQSSENTINWARVGQRFRSMDNGSQIWIFVIASVFVLVLVGYFFIYETETERQTPSVADSLASIEQSLSEQDSLQLQLSDVSDSTTAEKATNVTLPDTLELVVYAANDKLEPVRVKSDLFQETYPYWLEQGHAMRFNFIDTIRVRGQYSRMIVLLNGHPIQNFRSKFYQEDQNELVIHRSFFEGTSDWKTQTPSLEEMEAPPPDSILDRPTFIPE